MMLDGLLADGALAGDFLVRRPAATIARLPARGRQRVRGLRPRWTGWISGRTVSRRSLTRVCPTSTARPLRRPSPRKELRRHVLQTADLGHPGAARSTVACGSIVPASRIVRIGSARPQCAEGFQARHARHRQIEQQQVRLGPTAPTLTVSSPLPASPTTSKPVPTSTPYTSLMTEAGTASNWRRLARKRHSSSESTTRIARSIGEVRVAAAACTRGVLWTMA